jgi:2-iminobutanoate/2-iminopropanoate deaminase
MATRSNGTDSARHQAQAEIHIPEAVIPAFAGTTNHLEGAMKKSFVRGTWQVERAFSPCVITEGAGRTIYIAGHTGQVDDGGKSLAGDFDAQFQQTFRNIEKTLAEAGAKLSDMVTMTVFLIDARYTTRMTELRTELFGKDFPASAAITVQGFAQPEMMIEVQGIAATA